MGISKKLWLKTKDYDKSKRKHWGIENGIHWVLNISFREDESRMRAGNAANNITNIYKKK